MEASNPPAQDPIITQILQRLDVLQKENKALTTEVDRLKQTVQELKSSTGTRPLNRVQTAAGHLVKTNKDQPPAQNPKPPVKDRVVSMTSGNKGRRDEKKQEPEVAKDDKKDQPKKREPKVNPPTGGRVPTAKRPEQEKKEQEVHKRDSRAHTRNDPKANHHEPQPNATPANNRKDIKKGNDKTPPPPSTKGPAEKEPKKIMGGAKKDEKKNPPVANGDAKHELAENVADMKLDKADDKHVEIEKLELPELTEPTTNEPVAAEPQVKSQEQLLVDTSAEPPHSPPTEALHTEPKGQHTATEAPPAVVEPQAES